MLAQVKAAWLAIRAAWFWLKWVLVLALLLSVYLTGRSHGAKDCQAEALQDKLTQTQAALDQATKQAEKDAHRSAQEAVAAQEAATAAQARQAAAQKRVRALEAALADAGRERRAQEDCRLPKEALDELRGSMK